MALSSETPQSDSASVPSRASCPATPRWGDAWTCMLPRGGISHTGRALDACLVQLKN